MLRWAPSGDNSDGSINLTRNGLEQTLKGFGGHVETIDGLGKAAFWAGMTKSLNVFIGEDKFAIITVPASEASKEQAVALARSEEHTSELQSLMRISYAVFCLTKKNKQLDTHKTALKRT